MKKDLEYYKEYNRRLKLENTKLKNENFILKIKVKLLTEDNEGLYEEKAGADL